MAKINELTDIILGRMFQSAFASASDFAFSYDGQAGGQEGLSLIPRFLVADKRQKLALGFIPLIVSIELRGQGRPRKIKKINLSTFLSFPSPFPYNFYTKKLTVPYVFFIIFLIKEDLYG